MILRTLYLYESGKKLVSTSKLAISVVAVCISLSVVYRVLSLRPSHNSQMVHSAASLHLGFSELSALRLGRAHTRVGSSAGDKDPNDQIDSKSSVKGPEVRAPPQNDSSAQNVLPHAHLPLTDAHNMPFAYSLFLLMFHQRGTSGQSLPYPAGPRPPPINN